MHRVQLLASLEPGPVSRWAADALFDDLDLNRDGVVTRDEFRRGMTPLVQPTSTRPVNVREELGSQQPLYKELLPSSSSAHVIGHPEQFIQRPSSQVGDTTPQAADLYSTPADTAFDFRDADVAGLARQDGRQDEALMGQDLEERMRADASYKSLEEPLPVQPCRTLSSAEAEELGTERCLPTAGRDDETADRLLERPADEAMRYTQEAKARNRRLQRESYELHRAAHQVFDAFDVHNNGVITRQEFRKALYKSAQQLQGVRLDAASSADGAVVKVLDELSSPPQEIRRSSQVSSQGRGRSSERYPQAFIRAEAREPRSVTTQTDEAPRLACSEPLDLLEEAAQTRGCWRERRNMGQRVSETCDVGAGLPSSSGNQVRASSSGANAFVREQLPRAKEVFAQESASRRWGTSRCAPDLSSSGNCFRLHEASDEGSRILLGSEQPCSRGWRQRGYADELVDASASSHAAPYQHRHFQERMPVKEQLQPIGVALGETQQFAVPLQPTTALWQERRLDPAGGPVDVIAASAGQVGAAVVRGFLADGIDDTSLPSGFGLGSTPASAAAAAGRLSPYPEALHDSHRHETWQQRPSSSYDAPPLRRSAADKLFDELDANGDGVISREELLMALARHVPA